MEALMDGGTPAAKEIADRIEGKPPQRMEIVGTERKVVTLEVIFRKKISETPSE
jgi:hypothetical protein